MGATGEVETFWPEARALRRLRRTVAVVQTAPIVFVLLLGGAILAGAMLARGVWSLPRLWATLAPATGAAFVLSGLAALIAPAVELRGLRRKLARLIEDAPALLAPGERLEAVCLGSFLGPRGYRLGFLVASDRRLLRVEREGRRLRRAEIAAWGALARVEPTDRHVGGHPLLGSLLRLLGADRGVRFTAQDGAWTFFVTDRSFLVRLEPWLEARAAQVGVAFARRNDVDLERAERPPEPRFDELTPVGARGRWAGLREVPLAVAALTFATLLLVFLAFVLS